MRKVFSIFTLAMLLLATTACSEDKNDDINYKVQGEFLNNSVRISTNQSVCVSSSLSYIEWNVNANTMSVNYTVTIEGSNTVTLNIKDVQLTPNNTLACYTFETPEGGSGVTAVKGYYSPDTGNFFIEFTANGTHRIISAAQLFFYVKCTVNNLVDTSKPAKVNDNAGMLIEINPNTMKANVAIANFALDTESGVIQTVRFQGLNVEATSDGYKVTDTSDLLSLDAIYTLNEFEANVTNACHAVNGSFKISTLKKSTEADAPAEVLKFGATLTGTALKQ